MGATASKEVESILLNDPLSMEKIESASFTDIPSSEKVESVSFNSVLSKKEVSPVILDYLDRQSILQLSLASKNIRGITKTKLFSKILLISKSITDENIIRSYNYPRISKKNEVIIRDLLEKHHGTIQELTISQFSCAIWSQYYQKLTNIRSLTLVELNTSQKTMVKLICSLPMLANLLIKDLFVLSWNKEDTIQTPNLPDSLIDLQLFNSKAVFNYSMYRFFNTHSNLKYLRVEHEKLLERLLDPYPSLEHLVVRLSDKTQLLRPSFLNLINLRTLDLLYTKLSYSDIESILKLRNLEELKFNSKLEPFNSDMKPILCTSLKQLAIRSPISSEWIEFFLNSCTNIESLKLVYSKSSPIFTKPEIFNQLKHLIIIHYSSEKFDLQALLQSQALEKLELIVSCSIEDYSIKFFEKIDLASNWKFTIINNRIVFYKLKYLYNSI
ncbi:hypothetical protein CONCODRAFT_84790, partial [Conidiobolus coronatus NRRL 28638]